VLHLGLPGSVESYYQEIGRAGRDGKPARAVLMHHAADRKTHDFFLKRDYPDESALEQLFTALGSRPVNAQTLRKKVRSSRPVFEKALEKLAIHGGVRGVAEGRLVRGDDAWRAAYAAQRRLRLEQLALMAKFAAGSGCRMLSLVEHFGDQQDSGLPCGTCDACAPATTIKGQAPSLHPARVSPREKPARKRAAARKGRRGKSSSTTPRRRVSRRGGSSSPSVALPATGPSAPLVAALRAWRLQESKQRRVPAFRVLTNRALVAIAEARPCSTASLRAVTGVGPKLLQTYGAQLVGLCTRAL
jgi:superfamily II DNA helicase RecQ